MEKRIFIVLSLCQFLLGIIVGVAAPLVPIYLKELGARPVQIGYFMSVSGLMSFLLPIAVGRISDMLGQRKLPLIVCSALSVPLVLISGRISGLFYFGLLFIPFGALIMTVFSLVNTISGLFAKEATRGKTFGGLRTVRSVGAITSGVFSGRLVDIYGFHIFFWMLALVMALIALVSIGLKEKGAVDKTRKITWALNLGRDFYHFIGAVALFSIADRLKMIVLPLFLKELGFTLALITLASSIFRIVGIPLTLYLGAISDRFGRKRVLTLAFLGYACYFLLMSISRGVPGVFSVQILRVTVAVIQAVGAAYVADLVRPEALGTGMAVFQGTFGLGGVLGGVLTGHSIEDLGMVPTLWIGGALGVFGMILLSRTRRREEIQECLPQQKDTG